MKETDNLNEKKTKKKYNQIFKINLYYLILNIIIIFIIIFIFFKKKIVIKNKISVIIPTYNRAKLLNRCLTSILNQTYKNIEIIVVDDGSTDNTKKIIYKINDNRIKYIKLKKNNGPSYARNFGIKKSKGEFISFQDSDDIYHKEKLEKQFKNLKIKNSDLDFCKICIYLNETYKIIFPTNFQENKIFKNDILGELINGNFISTQSILIKKYIIEKNLFDLDLPRLIDYDLVLRLVTKIKFSYTPEILVELFRQNDSIGNSSSKLKQAMKILYNKTYDFNSTQKKILLNTFKMFKRRI